MNKAVPVHLTASNVIIAGQDISSSVRSVQFLNVEGAEPAVRLDLVPDVQIECDAIVYVQAPYSGDPVLAFLASVSPDELDALVLERMTWGQQSTSEVMLQILKEMAQDG